VSARGTLLALTLLAAGGCYYEPVDLEAQPVKVILSGSCAPGEVTLEVTLTGGLIAVTNTANTELPVNGALSAAGGSIRGGNWRLFGPVCPTAAAGCAGDPARFRLCTAIRAGSALDLECIDGLARPVCRGSLRE
jgi:hypothetical protein